MASDFSQLPLCNALVTNVKTLGFSAMTPIQERTLPAILEGRDLIAQAQTGSGKTVAFGLGVLEHLHVKQFRIQALLICPTRELASQVAGELRRMARTLHNVKILELCGGAPMKKQIHSLSHEAHIVVGTPGRLLAHLERGTLSLEHLKMLVLDEADRMLDMGFYDDIAAIIEQAPKKRQTLLFSATFSEDIRTLAHRFLHEAVEIDINETTSPTHIEQHFYRCDPTERHDALLRVLGHYQKARIMIFCNTKIACDTVADTLYDNDMDALAIHSDLEQFDRNETLILFANGSCSILVATDVAARGLDIDAVDLVINYELPYDDEVYTHRIGRTGRAGKEGISVSLCQGDEPLLQQIAPQASHTLETLPPQQPDYTLRAAMATLFISGGKKEKLRPGDIVGALTATPDITADAIGNITVFDTYSYVALRQPLVNTALKFLQNHPIKGRMFRVRLLHL